MVKPSHDPSIYDEPHLKSSLSKDKTDNPFLGGRPRTEEEMEGDIQYDSRSDRVDHTVWDEPTILANEKGPKLSECEITYERWITAGMNRTTWLDSLSITLILVITAGPGGILGALMLGFSADSLNKISNLFTAVFLAPVTEEITKVVATLWVVEKRPYWFKSIWQIVLCAIAGGALFAVIENLFYIYLFIPGGDKALEQWRWIVCTGLHISCSFIVGIGLARIWSNAIRNRCRPELAIGMPYFATAMIVHGVYNFSSMVAQAFGLLVFN